MILGEKLLLARLRLVEEEMDHKVAVFLKDAGGYIVDLSIHKQPWKTGELAKRSFSEGPLQLKSGEYEQIVGYEKKGGDWDEDNEYAVYVHEDMEANHPIGAAKFLELAVKEGMPEIRKIMKKEVFV